MIVLGIETSCDETAAAIVGDDQRVRAEVVRAQLDAHRPFGGVVPEIAARAHVELLDRLIAAAFAEAGLTFRKIDAVAATAGPGLIGALMVGLVAGKAIAAATRTRFVAVNHLEAHALSVRLTQDVPFPYLLLLTSGGHCQLLVVAGVGRYQRLGTTIDDAAGEAFDKAARLLGLGYPGGPAIERTAAAGDAARFDLPRPMRGRPGCHFSFSGLKTALRLTVAGLPTPLAPQTVADLAAGFQAAVADCLVDRTANAAKVFRARYPGARTLVVAGGVAANRHLRARLETLAGNLDLALVVPPARLCTDNGAMVAWAGIERLRLGLSDPLHTAPRARWPLDPTAEPAIGAGVKA